MKLGIGIRIRPAKSVGSIFDPNSISGLTHWYAPDSIVDSGGSFVSWDDKIGSLDFTGALKIPILSTLNGLLCINMGGTGEGLANTSAFSESGTIFWVQETSDTVYATLNGDTSTTYSIVANNSQAFTYTNGFNSPTVYVNSVLQSWSDRADAYNSLNGRKVVSQVGFSASWGELKWGQNDSQAAWHFQGKISEMLIYNSSLSSGDRELVEQYLIDKYNVS